MWGGERHKIWIEVDKGWEKASFCSEPLFIPVNDSGFTGGLPLVRGWGRLKDEKRVRKVVLLG